MIRQAADTIYERLRIVTNLTKRYNAEVAIIFIYAVFNLASSAKG
jgi:hypothetical protein